MIKIMIAEDMSDYREYLKKFIDWKSYGFEVCCEARDGKEALTLYEEHQPDIVLADIMMPYIDGLVLSGMLLEENPDLAIILITGNSEFEYARKAVKLGVCDYIVKPFEKEELLISLLKLQDNINKMLELQNQQDEMRKERKDQLLRELIYAKNAEGSCFHENQDIFKYPYFLVAAIRAELHENEVEPAEIVKWKQVFSSMLNDMIQIEGELAVFHDFEGNIVTILNFKDRDAMETYEGFEFEDIRKLAKEHIGFEVSVGISDYCYDSKQLRAAYYQTIQALSHFYAAHQGKIFDYKKMIPDSNSKFYSRNLIDEINKNLELLDATRISELITEELDQIKEYENPPYAVMIYMSLLSVLFSYLVKFGRNIDDIFGKGFHPYSVINDEISYESKRSFIFNSYRRAIEYQIMNKETKSAQIAKQAKDFILSNFENANLTIDDISRKLLVNQTYLRRMFKDEYQMTISDYITKCRMEQAKALLEKENCKISYVSGKVGYNDASYFSKCFKKYYGYLPSNTLNRQ